MAKIGSNLMTEAKLLPPFDECPTPNQQFIINIIIWNSRGALKPNFRVTLESLLRIKIQPFLWLWKPYLGVRELGR